MTTNQSSNRLRFISVAGAIAATTLLSACGTNLEPNLVEVSGRKVEIVEAGSGDATVVFEAGFGNDWTPWDDAATEVAGYARVFAYSRPGYGGSASTTEPRDPEHIVENLRALLAARGYAPPYVLVGHSFGGTYMELFAKKYPDEVRGLVLVDTRPHGFSRACDEGGLTGCAIPEEAVSSLPAVQIAEYRAFAQAFDQIGAAGRFGTHPVRVLTGTEHGFSQDVEALWISMHGELAAEAPNGEQRVFRGAGHYLQLDRTHDVAETIRRMLPPSR